MNIDINNDLKDPKIVYLGDVLDELEKEKSIEILKIYSKIFTFGYDNMLGMDPNIVFHNIVMHLDAKPVK